MSDGQCTICGAHEALHHYEGNWCPKNGREETRDVPQEWQDTVFTPYSKTPKGIGDAAIDRYRASLRKRVEERVSNAKLIHDLREGDGANVSYMRGQITSCDWFLSILDEQTEKI